MVAADAVAAAGAAPWPVGVCDGCERVESSKTSQIMLLRSKPSPPPLKAKTQISFSFY